MIRNHYNPERGEFCLTAKATYPVAFRVPGGASMRSKTWRCAGDGYVRITPTPTEPGTCPICRGRLIEGMPTSTVELMPMHHGDALRYLDRVMREQPVGR